MAGSSINQHTPSASRDMNDIIEQYSSPAASSSPAVRARQPYDSSPAEGSGLDVSLSSSPPPYGPSLTSRKPSSGHQRNMTHSGYLDRTQLFGRTDASDLPSSPYPLPEAPRGTVKHKRNSRSSLGMPNGMGTAYSGTSTALSHLHTRRSLVSNMRETHSQVPQDEWIEAGSPEPKAEDDEGSFDYASWKARGGLVGTANGRLSYASSTTEKSSKTATEDAASIKTLSLVVTTIDQVPVLPHRRLACAKPVVVFAQKPQLLNPMSPVTTTILQGPISAISDCGLSLAAASAIIHGCMTFAAMRRALLGLDTDISAMDLALDLYATFLVGVSVCVVLHMMFGGKLEKALGNMGRAVGKIYASMADDFQQGRGH